MSGVPLATTERGGKFFFFFYGYPLTDAIGTGYLFFPTHYIIGIHGEVGSQLIRAHH